MAFNVLVIKSLYLQTSRKMLIFDLGNRPLCEYGQGHDHKAIAGPAGGFKCHYSPAEPYHTEHAVLVQCNDCGVESHYRQSGSPAQGA